MASHWPGGGARQYVVSQCEFFTDSTDVRRRDSWLTRKSANTNRKGTDSRTISIAESAANTIDSDAGRRPAPSSRGATRLCCANEPRRVGATHRRILAVGGASLDGSVNGSSFGSRTGRRFGLIRGRDRPHTEREEYVLFDPGKRGQSHFSSTTASPRRLRNLGHSPGRRFPGVEGGKLPAERQCEPQISGVFPTGLESEIRSCQFPEARYHYSGCRDCGFIFSVVRRRSRRDRQPALCRRVNLGATPRRGQVASPEHSVLLSPGVGSS